MIGWHRHVKSSPLPWQKSTNLALNKNVSAELKLMEKAKHQETSDLTSAG